MDVVGCRRLLTCNPIPYVPNTRRCLFSWKMQIFAHPASRREGSLPSQIVRVLFRLLGFGCLLPARLVPSFSGGPGPQTNRHGQQRPFAHLSSRPAGAGVFVVQVQTSGHSCRAHPPKARAEKKNIFLFLLLLEQQKQKAKGAGASSAPSPVRGHAGGSDQ